MKRGHRKGATEKQAPSITRTWASELAGWRFGHEIPFMGTGESGSEAGEGNTPHELKAGRIEGQRRESKD